LLKKYLQQNLILLYSRPVAVVGNEIEAVCTCFLSFVNFVGIIYKGLPPESSCKRLFLFLLRIRTPHDSSESAWTAWKKTPHTSTPLVQNVTSVDLATGKATGTSVVNKASCISEQIRQAHLGLFGFSMSIGFNMNINQSGEGRIEMTLSTLGETMSKGNKCT